MKKILTFLLRMAAMAALVVAIASSAAEYTTVPLKLQGSSDYSVNVFNEEMVSRLMVKPRQQTGNALAHALQFHDASGLSKTANIAMTVVRPMSDGAHVIKLDKPVTLTEARLIAARLMQDSSVELAEPDRMMHASATPTDPAFPSQWHYFAPTGANKGGANLPTAWDTTTGIASITVAVLDTGYRQHADLGTVLQGYDFITDVATANDGDARDIDAQDPGDWVTANECGTGSSASNSVWHGTHVAGTIAALMNNGLGVTGIAPNVKILPVRVLGKCGGFFSDIIDGMRWAAGIAVAGVPANARPAHVLNMSLGASGACSVALQSAVTDVVNAGKVIVAATGNANAKMVDQPANCTGVIAVTAHAIDGDKADYANTGAQTAISAPGGGCGLMASGCTVFVSANGLGIFSLWNSGTQGPDADSYAYAMGTSMAVPHVVGVAALMLSVDSELTPAQIKSYLQSSARAFPVGTTCTQGAYAGLCGAGLLDAQAALAFAANLNTLISFTNDSQVVSPGATVTLSGSATPAPGRSISTYAWTQLTGTSVGTISNANAASATFIAPTTGSYTFQLTVTDSTAQNSNAVAMVRVNSPPVLTAIATQTGHVGQAFNFTVGATDVDGDAVTFHSVLLPPGATLSTGGVFSWPSPTLGSYSMTYYASDNDANSAQSTVNITVAAAPPPPPSSGGGSLDGDLLIALASLTVFLRIYRARQSVWPPR